MMKSLVITIAIISVSFATKAQSFQQKTISIGNIGLNITNSGTIGTPNVRSNPQGPPSMEYPLNSGVEHLFEAGLWIGAITNGQIAVSTASIDDASGYSTGKGGFEYSPEPNIPVIEKSKLTGKDNFSTTAISHQDVILNFTDRYTVVPNTTTPIQDHTIPLGANVKLETYAWNFSFADYFVILNYKITNKSTLNWDSVYLGIWSDLIVRNVNVSKDAGAAFFNKGSVGFVDSMSTVYAYDITGDPGYTNSYGAIQFLGAEWRSKFFHPNNAASFTSAGLPAPRVNGNFWTYNLQAPTTDALRYDRMKEKKAFNDPSLNTPGNRVQLISAGPFTQIAPGESVDLVFGFVCARQIQDNSVPGVKDTPAARAKLLENLGWSKRTYLGEDVNENGILDPGEDLDGDGILDRFILPEPPAVPKVKILTESGKVVLYWGKESEESIDPISKKKDFEGYRVYRSNPGDDKKQDFLANAKVIAQWDKPGNSMGFNNGFNNIRLSKPVKFDGDTVEYHYKFEVDNQLNGWQYLYVITAFDEGDGNLDLPSLESSYIQNSYRVFTGQSTKDYSTFEGEPAVYPNPYALTAAWDGTSSRSKKLMFYNLPEKAEIRIYTISGDVVATLIHDANSAYNGSKAEWYKEFAGSSENVVSAGGEHGWDILSDNKQSIAPGLYLFTVKDLKSGKIKKGKFAVVK